MRAPSLRSISWTPLHHAVLMLVLIVVAGALGYAWIEGWSLWDSAFFTIVTITTVGYGDNGLSVRGEQFTVLVMIAGIGTLTYAVGQTMSVMIRYQFDKERLMNKQISKLDSHVIICGLGRIGTAVAGDLRARGVPFVGIDRDERRVQEAEARGWLAIVGDATDEKLLLRVRPDAARGVAIVTDDDTENIVAVMTIRQLMPDLDVIARIESRSSESKMRLAGATRIFMPSELGSRVVTDALLLGESDAVSSASPFRLVHARVGASSDVLGSSLGAWTEAHPRVSIVAAIDGEGHTNLKPNAQVVLGVGDTLVLAGDSCDVDTALMEIAGSSNGPA